MSEKTKRAFVRRRLLFDDCQDTQMRPLALPDRPPQRSFPPHRKSPTTILGSLVDRREHEKPPNEALAARGLRHLFAVKKKKTGAACLVLRMCPYLRLVKPPVLQELEERKPRGGLEEDEHFC